MTTRHIALNVLAAAMVSFVPLPQVFAAAPQPAAETLAQAAGVVPTTVTIYSSANPQSFDPQQWVYNQRMGDNSFYTNPDNIPGFGVVKEMRTLKLKAGENKLDFTDVPAFIDPTTVSFQDLTVPGTEVLDQRFKFDLLSSQSLLNHYINRTVIITAAETGNSIKQIQGTLLSDSGNTLIVQNASGIHIINAYQRIRLGKFPRDLLTKPTLEWNIFSPHPGKQKVLTSYETKGLTWIADYNLVLGNKDAHASLAAWVTLMNLSGKTYRYARLKLIAGNPHTVQPPRPMYMENRVFNGAAMPANTFKEKSFFEYHIYTLPRLTTINQNATQQIALFPTRPHISVKKVLVYSGQNVMPYVYYGDSPDLNRNVGIESSGEVGVYIDFHNTKANTLGIPLPKGKIRVFKADPADGTLEFLGEDLIHNTPRDQDVSVQVGKAFDITGKRVQTNFLVNSDAHWLKESFSITLNNHKKTAATVLVKQYLYRWENWKITARSDKFKKLNSREIRFTANVPAHGKKVITYTVKYSW
jgi:filamentous hemagglutinin family protein